MHWFTLHLGFTSGKRFWLILHLRLVYLLKLCLYFFQRLLLGFSLFNPLFRLWLWLLTGFLQKGTMLPCFKNRLLPLGILSLLFLWLRRFWCCRRSLILFIFAFWFIDLLLTFLLRFKLIQSTYWFDFFYCRRGPLNSFARFLVFFQIFLLSLAIGLYKVLLLKRNRLDLAYGL